jgi:hypothetical protein
MFMLLDSDDGERVVAVEGGGRGAARRRRGRSRGKKRGRGARHAEMGAAMP